MLYVLCALRHALYVLCAACCVLCAACCVLRAACCVSRHAGCDVCCFFVNHSQHRITPHHYSQHNCVEFYTECDHLANGLRTLSDADMFVSRAFSTTFTRESGDRVYPEEYVGARSVGAQTPPTTHDPAIHGRRSTASTNGQRSTVNGQRR